MLNSGSLGPREKSRPGAVLEEGGMIHHVPSAAQVWQSGCHSVPESCCVLGAESSLEESCDNASETFSIFPTVKRSLLAVCRFSIPWIPAAWLRDL